MVEAVGNNIIDFGPPNWLSVDDAFAQFLVAAVGDPRLAARDLQQSLENGRLKSGYVRMPMQYRESHGGPLTWIPENKEHGLLSCQFWRTECQVHSSGPRVRCVPLDGKAMAGRYLFFVQRSDLDAIFTPAETTATAILSPVQPTTATKPSSKLPRKKTAAHERPLKPGQLVEKAMSELPEFRTDEWKKIRPAKLHRRICKHLKGEGIPEEDLPSETTTFRKLGIRAD